MAQVSGFSELADGGIIGQSERDSVGVDLGSSVFTLL